MRKITITKNVYTFNEADHRLKQLIIANSFENDPHYGSYMLEEHIDSLKSLANYLRTTLDYSISLVPDRGEFIKFGEFDLNDLKELDKDNCPLTGCYADYAVIEALEKNDMSIVIDAIQKKYQYMLTNEAIAEHCEANGYEFLENGAMA